MELIKRHPGVGYLDTWLWLPKSHTSINQISGALSYPDRSGLPVPAWYEEEHHFRVPRNYISPGLLGSSFAFPTYDTRFQRFPRANITSSVTLDSKEKGKTYQSEGSRALLEVNDGILCLRCGAGKTVVALHTASLLKVPILITVDDKGLAGQWVDEIKQHLGIPEDDIGMLWGSKPFRWEKPVAVATVQSLAHRVRDGALPEEMTRHFGVVLLDEAHVMGAPYFNTAIPPFHGRRWGLSATPIRDDDYDSLLKYTVGPVVYTYLTPALKPTVWFLRIPLTQPLVPGETHDVWGNFHFGKTFGHLARDHTERTRHIVRTIRDMVKSGRQVLVLSHSRDMVEILGTHFPDGGVTHGGVKSAEHQRVVRECNPVISIMKRGKQALNKPSLDTVLICDPFSKANVLQQTMGRALRSFEEGAKKDPLIMFIEDYQISPLRNLCGKLRLSLTRWPDYKGGSIPFKIAKV